MDRLEISKKQFLRESEAMQVMVDYLEQEQIDYNSINCRASKMVEDLRNTDLGLSVEVFLDKYNLSTNEGAAIMCLAEALLRIPDRETADRLIESTFHDTKWDQYLSDSESFFFNAASWGMLMTGKTVNFAFESKQKPMQQLRSLVKRTSEPVIRNALRSAMKLIATQFVMGETIDKALKKASKFEKQGYSFSYDILGEGARTKQQAERYYNSYKQAIEKVANYQKNETELYKKAGVSIKLTALHPRYELLQKERVISELLPKVVELIRLARELNIAISIDAEEANRLDIELELFEIIRLMPEFQGYNGIGFVLQAYQNRAFYVVDYLIDLAKKSGSVIPIRLVKGAYWDSEIKHGQELGIFRFPVFTNKYSSDVSYMACAKKILDNHTHFFPQFATHNAHTISAIMEFAGDKKFEFQRLYGMAEKLYESVVAEKPCRIYAPIGEHKDLLAYLIRRLLENGANSSFINVLLDKEVPVPKVIEDPLIKVKEDGGKRNKTLPIPSELYGKCRQNSKGIDYGNLSQIKEFEENLQPYLEKEYTAPKNIEISDIPKITEASVKSFESWKNVSVEERAEILEKAADLIEENTFELTALCMKEAGKVLQDIIPEIREAIDFCRYYAANAKELMTGEIKLPGVTGESNSLSYHPRGMFVCISPWNFPLAIFTGQIAAALVTGNTVIAKPAEQTPKIAAKAVEILHQAGIPRDVLQLACGQGASIGAELIKQPNLKGVCFTGSTATAKAIQKSLAENHDEIIPLIAETGGQNCMIADSSTLLEQLCDDVVNSAFNSAGQRCSALRVLFLPNEIADTTLNLISNAMDELKISDPANLSTDIGPVIDEKAKENLQKHSDFLNKSSKAKLIKKLDVPIEGTFFAPQLWEIDDLSILEKENFGPILHVIRYNSAEIESLYEQINNLKFGLTFGMHTRVHKQYNNIENQINAGNIYINRNITGAIVGTQPFGGEGLSGTGFKAGGPNYLLRFLTERTLTINTSAIGGNIDLLMRS